MDYESRKLSTSTLNDEIIKEYEWFLEKVNAQPEHMPMAATWLERPLSNTKELRVHKVFSRISQKKRKKSYLKSDRNGLKKALLNPNGSYGAKTKN